MPNVTKTKYRRANDSVYGIVELIIFFEIGNPNQHNTD
ncbi:MAG: hypothetical protein ACJAZB_001143 [Psychrosphaera sp.]|jgi:hypothetical protein